ncbi:MAG: response regulator, partial [Nitrospirota bacterium]
MPQPNVLIIDDEPLMRISIADALKDEGCQVKVAATGLEGMDLIKKESFEIVISDLRLPGMDGLQILQTCKEVSPKTGVIVITAHGSVETAVGAMKMGAYDYITKPFSMDELLLIVNRLLKVLELEDENRSLREELEGRFSFKGLLGKNDKMREVLEKIKLVAPTDSTVLIL